MGYYSVLILALFSAVSVIASEKHVVCYYGTWATYRPGLGKFDVDHINPHLCTHLIYTFVGINEQGFVISLDSYLDLPDNWGRDNFGKFNALKHRNPKLKTILAVGGWNEASAKYSNMAANPTLRQNFVSSALKMVLDYGFDGFDVDWEYPGSRDTVMGPIDKANFVTLLRELKDAFAPHGLLITAAVSAGVKAAEVSYDVPAVCQYLDMVHLMAYDMYGAWDSLTGHNAPLHKGEGFDNVPKDEVFTVDIAVEYWLSRGCPAEKIVLGVPLYGRTFALADPNVNGVRAPNVGAGIAGPFTREPGNIGYNEFCDLLKTQSWNVRYDERAKVPYAFQDRNWVTYDDPDSITTKVHYALSMNLGGIMVWSVETDDFHGLCGESNVLLKTINRVLGNHDAVSITSTAGPIPTTTTIPSTTAGPNPTIAPGNGICQSEGFNSNPHDCSEFIICVRGDHGELIPNVFKCPHGLLWDKHYLHCNVAELVDC